MTVEVEFRLQNPTLKGKIFINFLIDVYYKKILETVEDISFISLKESNVRIITDKFRNSGYKMLKETISNHFTPVSKMSISRETVIDENLPESTLQNLNSGYIIRSRKRHIIQLDKENRIFLHLTEINDNSYEIEIEKEYTEEEWDENELKKDEIDFLTNFFEKWYDDNIKHPLLVFESFLQNFNEGVKYEHGKMNSTIISRPRDLEKNDFITSDNGKRGLPEGYSLTVKGNGHPVLLHFDKKLNSVLKVIPDKSFEIIADGTFEAVKDDFIVIGEYFEKDPMFVPFDILFLSSHPFVRNAKNHIERMRLAETHLERNRRCFEKFFKLYIKKFTPIGKTPETFAIAYKQIKEEIHPFENDGMILTPIYAPHNPRIGKERMLSLFQETCKIKPWDELSIDFRIDVRSKSIYTYLSTDSYRGIKKYPFNASKMVKWNTVPHNADGNIVEFYPQKEEDQIYFVFSRIREDKLNANSTKVADSVWKKINEPFKESVFLGTDFYRLFAQNNRVKRKLIDSIPVGCVVVDIGTGRGGDILKYDGRAHTVICVEPNEKNLHELSKRLSQPGKKLSTNFVILKCFGQETDKISDALENVLLEFSRHEKKLPPVIVASMFSLTFFWKNRETLDAFENTLQAVAKLSPGAEFIFYTVEGTRFFRYFRQNKKNFIKSSGMRAQYKENDKCGIGIKGEIKIEIYDSILGGIQREYLVVLEDFKVLENLRIENGVIEPYLTDDERKYGNCSVFGRAKIKVPKN